jgi:hypothetical protein
LVVEGISDQLLPFLFGIPGMIGLDQRVQERGFWPAWVTRPIACTGSGSVRRRRAHPGREAVER